MSLTTAQVLDLAPDSQVRSDGQSLSNPRGWHSLGADETAIWGEVFGSGSKPYRVSVDLSDHVAKCSCPSRKFPCKHAIGRMLIHAAQPGSATSSEQPEWTSSWLAGRGRAAKAKASDKPVDEKAQAKRREAREAKVSAGMEELDLWLRDLALRGLASVAREDFSFWNAKATRMVDAQAPGIAKRIKAMGGMVTSADAQHVALSEAVARLWMISRAWSRREQLPPALQAHVRAAIGFAAEGEGNIIGDTWLVLGQTFGEDPDGIKIRGTWLGGQVSGTLVKVTDYAVGERGFPVLAGPGACFEGSVCVSPGLDGPRATLREKRADATMTSLFGAAPVQEALGHVATTLGQVPWLADLPLCLNGMRFGRVGTESVLGCEAGYVALVETASLRSFKAAAGNSEISAFGTWDGRRLAVLSVWNGKTMHAVLGADSFAQKVAA